MYTTKEGYKQLDKVVQKYQSDLKDTDVAKGLYIDIPVSAPGILPPSPEDVLTINRAVPFFELLELQENSFVLRMYAIKPISFLDNTEPMVKDAHCVEIVIKLAFSFLVALSMSTMSFTSWRSVLVPSTKFNGFSLSSKRGTDFLVEPVPLTIENPTSARMHAGHFAAALQIQNEIINWHDKFTHRYEKAQMLFSTPAHMKLNFCDEAYLNYFRCLEYLVMDKILEKAGNYTNHRLVDVFQKHKIQINRIMDKRSYLQFANKLDRQRDSAVAHLTRSNLDSPSLTGQQVYRLKTLIDILVFKHVNYRLYGTSEQGIFPIHIPFD